MKRKPYRFFLYILLEVSSIIILILPYRVTIFLAGLFGKIAYFILPKYRNTALDNLRMAFYGEKDEAELWRIAENSFANLGITAVEYVNLRRFGREAVKRVISEEDYKPLKEVLLRGKGAVVLVGHFGNWEMTAICAVAHGIPVSLIGKRIYYPPYNRYLVSLRANKGVKTIYRDDHDVLRKSLEVLRTNSVLGIAADQDVSSISGVFVNFFGRPAYTPTGPVVIAMLSGAPIVPIVSVRHKGRLRLIVKEPIYITKSGNKKEDILKYTQQWSDVLEKIIREYPDHWAWVHKRWKTQPGDKLSIGAAK